MKTPIEITGVVKKGKGRGKDLGFPTANIILNRIVPEGVYASIITIDNHTYQAASFVGRAETFGENELQLESYILDFNRNIYGTKITVKLLRKLRESKKFPSVQSLITAIGEDVSRTAELLDKLQTAGAQCQVFASNSTSCDKENNQSVLPTPARQAHKAL